MVFPTNNIGILTLVNIIWIIQGLVTFLIIDVDKLMILSCNYFMKYA